MDCTAKTAKTAYLRSHQGYYPQWISKQNWEIDLKGVTSANLIALLDSLMLYLVQLQV